MPARAAMRRTLASYVSPHAFAPRTRGVLQGLGYRVVPIATQGRFADDRWQPDLRIVDERHLEKLPFENYLPRTPIIVLVGGRPRGIADARVVGCVPRPADVEALYPLLQQALEPTPRRSARAATLLPARCTRADRRWVGVVVSLSREGCLFRTQEAMPPGLELNLIFPLPLGRMVSTRARVLRQSGEQAALEFTHRPAQSTRAIGDYVEQRLAIL
jgi:hypothetical protein